MPAKEANMRQDGKDALFELLRPKRRTAIVDIGANPIDGDPPYKAMLAAGLCTVIGFEPQAEPLAELERRKGPHERYLPYAVGDGGEHVLHVCREPGMSSLLAPDPDRLALFNGFPDFGAVLHQVPVATRRLDDIAEIECMDFLKIDVQGGELDVFRSGRRRLAAAIAVQTEISFVPLYAGQPAFGEIDTVLREAGFVPHCLAELKLRPLAPLIIDGDPQKGLRQLLEADLVYVRDFTRPDAMSGEQWKHLALIAHHCYDSIDLALRAINSAVQLGALPQSTPQRYFDLLQAQRTR
jgi:FkbM family methyltransferase